MEMTEEKKQAIYNAAQCLIDNVAEILNQVINDIKEVMKPIVEWIVTVRKNIEKYNCNNWRKVNGLPLLHRSRRIGYKHSLRRSFDLLGIRL